jgi:hypothetical protein
VQELPLAVGHRLHQLELVCNIGDAWGTGLREGAGALGHSGVGGDAVHGHGPYGEQLVPNLEQLLDEGLWVVALLVEHDPLLQATGLLGERGNEVHLAPNHRGDDGVRQVER